MKIFLASLSCLYALNFSAQNPSYNWANKVGADSTDFGSAITTDASGNVFTTGSCMGSFDFDLGVGTYTLPPAAGNVREIDIFISKTDPSGNLLWATRLGDTLSYENNFWIWNGSTSIATDASGNVYILGYFTGTVDFDPASGVYSLTSNSVQTLPKIFILKLNSSGNFVWAKHFSGSYQGYATSMIVTASGEACITGFFKGTLDADPGSATQNITSGDYGMFVVKLDATGNFLMEKNLSSPINSFGLTGWATSRDGVGNIYVTGTFGGTIDFDPGSATTTLTSSTYGDIYILKLDANGNFIWVKQIAAYESFAMTVDATNIYVTGSFRGTVDFDPGPSTHTLIATGTNTIFLSQTNQFVLKLDLNGNYIWSTNIESTLSSVGKGIAVDGASNVYAVGSFEGAADFDPGSGSVLLPNSGGYDGFILKLNPSGHFVWAKTISSFSDDGVTSITLDIAANIYMTGFFGGAADFDPTVGVVNLNSAGKMDAFTLKWSQCSASSPPLDVTSSQNKILCAPASASLSASAINPIAWYSSAIGTAALDTGITYVTQPLTIGTYKYYVGDLMCGGLTRTEIAVSVSDCTGIENVEDKSSAISIYPVPTYDGFVSVNLGSFSENMSVQICNAMGELIVNQKLISSITRLDLNEQPAGIYLVKILQGNKPIRTLKIIR